MEDVYTQQQSEYDDGTVFMSDVIQEDHELLFLDSYLRDVFRGCGARGGAEADGNSEEAFGEQSTL